MPGPAPLRLLARLLLPRRRREFVLGDLEELHAVRVERHGARRAALRYLRDVLGSAVFGRVGRNPPSPEPAPLRPRRRPGADAFLHDLRTALRSLLREKRLSALTILTLALGIGSTAAVFGMVNELVLRPLPGVGDADGAAYLHFRSREDPGSVQGHGLATPDVDALRGRATFLDGVASYGNASFHVSAGEGRPLSVWAHTVYGDFFDVLGVRPAEGRLLGPADTDFDGERLVAVLGQGLRDRLFGAEAAATGRTIRVNGRAVRVVGVAAGGFRGAERGDRVEMWVPYPALTPLMEGFTDEVLRSRSSVMHGDLVVRLRPGVSPDAAEGRIDRILSRVGEVDPEHGAYLAGLRAAVFPGLTTPPQWRAATWRTLAMLGGIVGLVLLVACANAANLLLFRNVAHRGGVAVRRALGASPRRIARTHLVRSLLVAALATLAGLGVAWVVALPLRGESLLRMPAFGGFVVDGRVLLFAAALSVLTTVLFGALPATLAGRFDLGGALREAGRRETGRAAGLRHGMAVAQIGLSLALLIGGVLLARTIRNLYSVDTGVSVEGVASIALLPQDLDPEEQAALPERLIGALEALPGVEGVAVSLYGPHGSRLLGRIEHPDGAMDEPLRVEMIPATASWFELLRLRTAEGAPLRVSREAWTPGNIVVTASLARRLFGGTRGVAGRTVRAGSRDPEEARILAVTGELRPAHAPDRPRDAFMVPFDPSRLPAMTVLVRGRRLDAATLGDLRAAVGGVLPSQPVPEPTLLTAGLDRIHSERRVLSRLVGILSAFATALAAVGLYGVVAFAVAGRRREIGVRMALGAEPSRIARLVLRFAGSIVLPGTALGVAGGVVLSRALESRLYGVEPVDAASYALAVLLFAAVVAVACWGPVRRARRVDPVAVLASE